MSRHDQRALQRMASAERRATWTRLVPWAGIAAWTAVWVWWQSNPSGLSWHFFVSGSHLLFDGAGLNLYAEHPELQIGPLAFLVAAPLTSLGDAAQPVALILMTAAGPLCLAWIARLVPDPHRRLRVFLAALVLMPAWTVLSVRIGHLDDVVALGLAVGALRAVAANRAALAGLALGAAVAAKPWALGFIPLLLVLDRQRLAAAGSAFAGGIEGWAPFMIANPATLAGRRRAVVRAARARLPGRPHPRVGPSRTICPGAGRGPGAGAPRSMARTLSRGGRGMPRLGSAGQPLLHWRGG